MTTHTFQSCRDIPPSAEHLQLLEYVREHPQCLSADAARALGRQTYTVTNQMQGLYVRGLVERVQHGALWRWEVA